MVKIKPRHIFLAVSAAAVVLFLRYVIFPPKYLPSEFSDARTKGAEIAARILSLSKKNLSRLQEVSKYDQTGDYTQALLAVSNALIENRENQVEAIRLSSQLQMMAQQIPNIQPSHARDLAAEAVSSEVTLVSRLVYYNNYLSQLFETLKVKFEKPLVSYLDGQVNDLVNKINDEAKAINELNGNFTNAMAEFDKIFNK